ncbi:multivesicular body subunit 12B-like [Acanthaster planci]|uniref:Multivesicular body subunit 12B-like n=1 Tax=Acanthaster planci TaxID=133434 RepID=A0A8B7ZGZ9_ACAPL|nr:multivesicular body subunit 12B-like [Acanthaster planci]
MADDSLPITGVCVVADKERRPVHYDLIENTTDNQDADIWKDSFFRKVKRYLCFTRQPVQGNVVLTDLTVIKEGDQIPQGYTAIPTTSDSKEPVLKKKILIVQLVMRGQVTKAICGIYLTSSKAKTRPIDASPRGEINGLSLYLKMGTLPSPTSQTVPTDPYGRPHSVSNPQPYMNNANMGYQGSPRTAAGSVAPAHPLPYQYPSRGSTLTRQASMIQTNAATERIHSAIEGVPFELHTSLQSASQSEDFQTPQLQTAEDVLLRYSYDFRTEQQSKQRNLVAL